MNAKSNFKIDQWNSKRGKSVMRNAEKQRGISFLA